MTSEITGLFAFFFCAISFEKWAQSGDSIFLFCYFKGNGDGLHYKWSRDGFKWKESLLYYLNFSKQVRLYVRFIQI